VDFQGVLQYTEGSQGSCGSLEPHPPFFFTSLWKNQVKFLSFLCYAGTTNMEDGKQG